MARNIRVEKYNTSRFDQYRFHNPDKKRNYIRIIHPKNILFLSLIIFDYILFIFSIILKRNLIVNQQSQATAAVPKTTTTDLPTEEPIGEAAEADPIDE